MPSKGRVDLVLAYIGDGYLAASMDASEHDEGVEFPQELRDEEGYEEVRAWDVPEELAEKINAQGCSDQWFGDGYEAAQAIYIYLVPINEQ